MLFTIIQAWSQDLGRPGGGGLLHTKYRYMYVHTYNISDDISLLCPTISGLNKMVEIAEQYAAEYSIIFNASKSKLLCFNESGCNRSSKCVTVNGDRIRPSDSVIHLGHYVSP